jgi:hypothetical protein
MTAVRNIEEFARVRLLQRTRSNWIRPPMARAL